MTNIEDMSNKEIKYLLKITPKKSKVYKNLLSEKRKRIKEGYTWDF